MAFNPTKFEAAVARNRRIPGIAVSPAVDMAFEKLLVSRQLMLYEQCSKAGAQAAGYFADASSLNAIESAALSMYNRLHNIETLAKQLKSGFVRGSDYHKRAFRDSINRAIGIDISPTLQDSTVANELDKRIKESVNLITKFDSEMLTAVSQTIWNGITTQSDDFSLRQQLEEKANVPAWRARLIARDQMGKLFGNLAQIRNQEVGITHYFWRTVGDNAVRSSHAALSNNRYAWASPPSVGHPGQDIQCRCIADPDFSTVKIPTLGQI